MASPVVNDVTYLHPDTKTVPKSAVPAAVDVKAVLYRTGDRPPVDVVLRQGWRSVQPTLMAEWRDDVARLVATGCKQPVEDPKSVCAQMTSKQLPTRTSAVHLWRDESTHAITYASLVRNEAVAQITRGSGCLNGPVLLIREQAFAPGKTDDDDTADIPLEDVTLADVPRARASSGRPPSIATIRPVSEVAVPN